MRVRSELSQLFEDRARFEDPANRYVARFALPLRRATAAAVDWALCYAGVLFFSIPLGMFQNLGRVSWEAGDFGGGPGHALFVVAQFLTITPVIAYWGLLLPTSQTFGMRATDLRVVSVKTGRGISYLRAFIRALVTTAFGVAFYAVFMDSITSGEDELDRNSQLILDASQVLAAIGVVSAAVMIVSATRRSILDRLFGTAVIDELEATTPRMGPWGPMDALDTSR